ncbi:MAG TPA: tripartite tricarboxylate transporter substrate binding protein [Burkholderiales bacterium]|nr:tripartite tricarboxylate transporter substrate binding protein [Burkholderiales bacterium]
MNAIRFRRADSGPLAAARPKGLRRGWQLRLLCFGASLALVGAAAAQDYPTRPVRLMIPFTAGSATDLLARRIAVKMNDNWGQQVVVDNRGGGGGTLASNIVAKAAPDGYTLLVHSIAFAMNAALYSNLPYDPIKDFAPVSQISISTSILVVAPALGVKSVKELIALAKQKPGQLNFASSGVGSGTHLNAEQFRFAAGIDAVHVPYKGVPEALIDLMTGRTHYFLTPLVPALPFLKDGRLLPLAVTTARRTPVLPDVPTMAEAALPGYEFQAWFGVFAPAKTPRPVIARVGKEVARIVELPDIKQQMQIQGEEGRASTPEEFARFLRAEIAKIGKIVKLAGIRVE